MTKAKNKKIIRGLTQYWADPIQRTETLNRWA